MKKAKAIGNPATHYTMFELSRAGIHAFPNNGPRKRWDLIVQLDEERFQNACVQLAENSVPKFSAADKKENGGLYFVTVPVNKKNKQGPFELLLFYSDTVSAACKSKSRSLTLNKERLKLGRENLNLFFEAYGK